MSSGSQHQIQKQRGHDERNGPRGRNHECTSQACPNIITLNYMNDSKVHLFLFVLISNYLFTLPYYRFNRRINITARQAQAAENWHGCRGISVALHAFPHRHKQSRQLCFPCLLRRYGRKVYRLGTKPVSSRSRICKPGHRHCGSHVAGKNRGARLLLPMGTRRHSAAATTPRTYPALSEKFTSIRVIPEQFSLISAPCIASYSFAAS
jgi:hypothetical protein